MHRSTDICASAYTIGRRTTLFDGPNAPSAPIARASGLAGQMHHCSTPDKLLPHPFTARRDSVVGESATITLTSLSMGPSAAFHLDQHHHSTVPQ